MLRRLLLPVLTAMIAVSSPATAGTWSAADDRRDVVVSEFSPEPEPCGTWTDRAAPGERATDITRVGIRHTRRAVRATVRFRDIPARGYHSTTVVLRSPAESLAVYVTRWSDRSSELDVSSMTLKDLQALQDTDPDETECGLISVPSLGDPCPRLRGRVDAKHERVVIVAPRDCLRAPRWVRMGAWAATTGEAEDSPSTFDRWQPRGSKPSAQSIGPFGPRVRVG